MKYLAFIISFYIISLSALPMVKVMRAEKAVAECGKKCCKHEPQKSADGCGETCSPFSCCLKTVVMFHPQERSLDRFLPESFIQHNFSNTKIFVSLTDFDIWHPPRVA